MEPNQEVAPTNRQLETLKSAVTSGNENEVLELLRRMPRLDSQITGEILWDAVLNNHFEVASMLIEAGADVNVTKPADEDWTHLLHKLACSDDQERLKLAVMMIKHGANVNAVDCYCFTPLRYAIRAESPIDVIRELLKHGAWVDSRLVVEAVDHPEATELMALLVGHSVGTETRSQIIHDALYYAVDIGFDKRKTSSAVKLLLDMRLPVVGEVMSQILVRAVRMENVEVVQLLIELGIDVNGSTPEVSSPLYESASLQQSTISELLIRAGADVNPGVSSRSRPIHVACREGSLENIKLLLRHGADVRVTDRRGRTPLFLIQLTERMSAAHRVVIQYLAIEGDKIDVGDLTIIEKYAETRMYLLECRRELKRMKSMKIMNDVSFYSALKNVRELAFLARYPSFIDVYNGATQRDEFSIYHDEMDFALERAKAWKNLLSEREKAICETLKHVVPYLPLERILFYLYLNDIE